MGVGAVDIDLFKQWKANAEIQLTVLLHILIGLGLLTAKLVTGKSENDQPFLPVLLI